MDATNLLSIGKDISLTKRLTSHFVQTQGRSMAQAWLLFGNYLDGDILENLAQVAQQPLGVIACWKVGHYEVALIADGYSAAVVEAADLLGLDCADSLALNDLPTLKSPGLIVMDMDSTAIQIECIDEIAAAFGVGEKVAAVTERAMQGELDFKASLHERVGTLNGCDASVLATIRDNIPMMPELREMVNTLKAYDWKVAIASGGFTFFSDYLKETLGLDAAYSNSLEIVDGKLTGKVLGDVVDAQAKADILCQLSQQFEIDMSNTMAIGDGANDLTMIAASGLGVAFHAKPKVVAQAPVALRHAQLGGVICLLSASLLMQQISWQSQP
ncbi:Phosphoserine phosphatase [Vibrio stylophorae]|uniref:Phosphoserine phosphatase n=1 Tax=Vibrio stylophorae TaxID=659351 RepID=A0ABM8ZR33_9VIBR|nr:phosphoserine phosphatase [Vibrio stylophorae]CAH0532728.1 Phosphoserine phosphatase [Vibrio stylophorae]